MKYLCGAILLCVMCGSGMAQALKPWHDHAVSANLGFVAFPATLDDKGPYKGDSLDGALETSASFINVLSDRLAFETALSVMKTSGTLVNRDGAYSLNYLDVDVTITALWLTFQYYPDGSGSGVLRFWYGGGLHAGMVEEGYRERIYVAGAGYYREGRTVKSTPIAGAHAVGGVNIYPVRHSAVCLVAEGRLNLTASGSDFKGSLVSPAVLIGLRWDFGMNPD